MYDRCSSSSIGCGETRGRDSWASSGMLLLYVQVDDLLRVFLDVLSARLDGFAHKDREQGVGGRGVLNRHLLQLAPSGIHRRLPQLLGVHFPQALVPLVHDPFLAEFLRQVFSLFLRVRVVEFLPFLDLVQGRLRDVHEAAVEERPHVSEEQRQEERRDVLPVHVCVGHRDDFVISDLLEIELFADARPDGGDERPDLLVLEHLIESGLFDVQDFPAKGKDRLELAATTLLGRSAGGRPFDDEQLRLRRIALLTIREFSGEVESFEQAFPTRELAGFACGLASLRRKHGFTDAELGDFRSLQEEIGELLVRDGLDDSFDLGVPEFHLRLPLELRFGDLEAEDRRQSLAGVVALEAFALFQILVVLRVLDEGPRKPGLESDEMGAAFDRVDVVHESEDRLIVAVVVLHRDFDERSLGFLRESDRIRVERVLRPVDPFDVLGDASLKLEDVPAVMDLIDDDDPKARVEEGELPQARREDVIVELDRFEDLRVRKERDDRAGPLRRAHDLEVAGLRPAFEPHPVLLTFSFHADLEPFAQPIDDREADAVQPAGHAVHFPFELPATVHPRQDDLDARRAVLRMDVDRDSPTVVCDRDRSVRVQGDLDFLAEAGHGFVNRVVHDLVDEVVEAARVDRADVHRRAFSDRLQAFEDLDLRGVVGGLFYHLFRDLLERGSVPSRTHPGGCPKYAAGRYKRSEPSFYGENRSAEGGSFRGLFLKYCSTVISTPLFLPGRTLDGRAQIRPQSGAISASTGPRRGYPRGPRRPPRERREFDPRWRSPFACGRLRGALRSGREGGPRGPRPSRSARGCRGPR